MDKKTQELMLSLIRAELCTDLSVITDTSPSDETLANIYRYSLAHDLAHMVGASLEKAGLLSNESLKSVYAAAGQRAIFRYANQSTVYEEVCALFEKEGIPYLPLKGSVMRDLYPTPEMRVACDIDILVPEEKIDTAVALLTESLGFEKHSKCFHDVSLMLGSVHLELHYNIKEDDPRLDPLLARVWSYTTSEQGSYRHKMTDEFFAFHIIAHTCYHFLHGGCGIKSLMDLWLLRHKTDFNHNGVLALCRECGIETFYLAICDLSDVWFSGAPHTSLTEAMQKYILVGGAYGTSSNKIIAQKNQKGGKLSYLWGRIFMPRYQLERAFPVLKKHPILLPICHVRRWIRVIKRGRGKQAVGEIAYTVSMPNERDAEIEKMLNNLGF